MNLVITREIAKKFGSESALTGVSLTAKAGERIALVGRNGAGKTTLLRILAGILPADSGSAAVAGYDVFLRSKDVRAAVGYLPEGAPLEPDMKVADYLRFRGKLRSIQRRRLRRRLHEVAEFCDLARLLHLPVKALSAGERRAVALADAILHEPRVLLLDDPLAALDPVQAKKFTAALASPQVSEGRLLIFSTHDEQLVRSVATRVLVLERGRVAGDLATIGGDVDLATVFENCSRSFIQEPEETNL